MNDDKRLSQMEAELKERFREAFDDYLKENGEEIPDPDLSFLNKPREKKRHSHIYRFATVAACVALIFVTSSSMAVWMNSEAAHAMKFNLEKTFHKITDGFFSTDEEENGETSENEISITIDSMEDIDDAVAFMPDLPIPEYIPEGYELKSLDISKYVNGTYSVEYAFENVDRSIFMINSRYSTKDQDNIGLIGGSEVIQKNDRTLYLIKDNYTSKYSVTFLLSNQFIDVTGDLDNDSMMEVAQMIYINK